MKRSTKLVSGFLRANLFRIKAFYQAYEKSRTAVRQLEELPIFNIPWGHNVALLQKIDNNNERFWYAQKTLENGWSRSTLEACVKSDLIKREGKAITNFSKTLPNPHSDKAQQSFLNRENLYRILSKRGNPKLTSIRSILHTLGLELALQPYKNN